MQVLAFVALGADTPGKEKAEVRTRCLVCTSVTAVFADVAPVLGGSFREIGVLAIATRPFIVPDVEDRAGLWWRFRGYG
jgi:hypothetical protein